MKTVSSSQSFRRLVLATTAIVALPMLALVPAYVASVMLTDQAVETDESTQQAVTIDVTDIDRNGTVMYTVSPPQDSPHVFEINRFVNVLDDSDMIRLTISDRGTDTRLSEDVTEDECNFTLYLSDSDEFDKKTSTYTGYIRIRDDEMRDPTWNHDSPCGIVITYDHESQ